MIDIGKAISIVEHARQRIIDTYGYYDCDADDEYAQLKADLDSLLVELNLENDKQRRQ